MLDPFFAVEKLKIAFVGIDLAVLSDGVFEAAKETAFLIKLRQADLDHVSRLGRGDSIRLEDVPNENAQRAPTRASELCLLQTAHC